MSIHIQLAFQNVMYAMSFFPLKNVLPSLSEHFSRKGRKMIATP